MLGDGIVAGSLVLNEGQAIGKSTLLLQVCRNLAGAGQVLYISGEESLKQIKMRGKPYPGPVTGIKIPVWGQAWSILGRAVTLKNPQIAVIDSIQTMYRGRYPLLRKRQPGKGSPQES